MSNIKMFEDFEPSINEDAAYKNELKKAKAVLDAMAAESMDANTESGPQVYMTIVIDKVELKVPFNADSYDNMSAFLEREAKNDI